METSLFLLIATSRQSGVVRPLSPTLLLLLRRMPCVRGRRHCGFGASMSVRVYQPSEILRAAQHVDKCLNVCAYLCLQRRRTRAKERGSPRGEPTVPFDGSDVFGLVIST